MNYLTMENNTDPTYCYYSDLPSPMAYMDNEPITLIPAKGTLPITSERQAVIDHDRIIEMAWEDRTPFDAIQFQFGLSEAKVKELMKKALKPSSYKLWRARVHACNTKHIAKRSNEIDRFKCNLQRSISNNKISKR
jgi:uncharacterized protein (TIGR03643 family)